MKFRLALVPLALLLLFGGEAAIAQPYPNNAQVCTNGYRLNLRETPGGPIIDILNDGDPVERIAPPAGSWQPVAADGDRGYVWSEYLCRRTTVTPDPDPNPPVGLLPRATCPDLPLARNVISPSGLNVYRAPNPNSEIVNFLNEGAAIILSNTTAVEDVEGGIWLPLEQPTSGYIRVGEGELVTNIGYCTRYYP